jgi:predicted transcriptional regulator
MEVDFTTILIRQVAQRRRKLGLTQAAVARLAGIRQSYLSAIETGKIEPRIETLQEIVRSLRAELVLVPLEVLPDVEFLAGHKPDPKR